MSDETAITERGVQITTMGEAKNFADMVVKSKLAPKSFDTAEKVMVAVQMGQEIGMSPMASLQAIAVINGKPSLYGDALPALVQASGKGYLEERFEGEGMGLVAICVGHRLKPDGTYFTQERTFSIPEAKHAGLWGKAGPWKSYPKRMLQMRARGFLVRDVFADVLSGLAVFEEVRDYDVTVTPGTVVSDMSTEGTSAASDPMFEDSTTPVQEQVIVEAVASEVGGQEDPPATETVEDDPFS